MLFKQRLGHKEKPEGDANDKEQAEKTGKNQSDQIKAAVFVTYAVAQDPPAKPRDQSNLIGKAGAVTHVSHESSSICARSAPSPTTERKISSRVRVRPSMLGTPARSCSIEPCATNWPLLIMAT